MSKVVNLRRARKRRDRDAARRRAGQAAARPGVDAAEAARARAERTLHDRRLEAHRRDENNEDDEA